MKTVIYHIDTHPIEPELLKKLRIYDTTRVEPMRVGTIMNRLIKAGFNNIDSKVEVSPYNFEVIIVTFRLTRTKDENGVYLK